MNLKAILFTCIGATLLASSCIKNEGLDREADIISVSIEDKGFLTTIINENRREISLIVEGDYYQYETGTIVPNIKVSKRATISPKSQEPIKLDGYAYTYNVTAEDGSTKTYYLKITPYNTLNQDFEGWNTEGSSGKTYDEPADQMWRTANGGISIVYPGKVFPTRKHADDKVGGEYSVLLETLEGVENTTLDLMNIPVFSGNMFRGKFILDMGAPLASTKFGQPHPKYLGKPIALTAQYKYKVGQPYVTWTYVDGKKNITQTNQVDKSDIYAVLYEVPKGAGDNVFLDGTNIKQKDHPWVVATAFMTEEDKKEKLEWTALNTKFTFVENKVIDFEKNDYKLAIVLASSEEGADYKGGIGSTLLVDNLRVVCESDPDADEFK